MSAYRFEVEEHSHSVIVRAYVDGHYRAAEGRTKDEAILNLVAFLATRLYELELATEAANRVAQKSWSNG